ncbi:hypothetical protein PCL_12713 [Purpureocillium lilacinum]|uniref:Uncharacterized protein n=1 Tax=Purpureocillium lilacinum TaxID=33203 RepID=A0A2U3E766_PURLI|nr:hypothetical protein PCL_12713 [Purpureocillium lilacinum]
MANFPGRIGHQKWPSVGAERPTVDSSGAAAKRHNNGSGVHLQSSVHAQMADAQAAAPPLGTHTHAPALGADPGGSRRPIKGRGGPANCKQCRAGDLAGVQAAHRREAWTLTCGAGQADEAALTEPHRSHRAVLCCTVKYLLTLRPAVRGRDHAEKAPPDTYLPFEAPPPPHPPKVARPRLPTAPAPTYLVHTVPGTSRLPASPSQRQATSLPPSPRRTGKSLHSSFFFFLCMCISPSTSIPLHSSAIARVLLATLPLLPQPTHPPRPRVASQHVDVGTLPLPSERASEPPSALPSGAALLPLTSASLNLFTALLPRPALCAAMRRMTTALSSHRLQQ